MELHPGKALHCRGSAAEEARVVRGLNMPLLLFLGKHQICCRLNEHDLYTHGCPSFRFFSSLLFFLFVFPLFLLLIQHFIIHFKYE